MYRENGIYDCLDKEWFDAYPWQQQGAFVDNPEKQKWIEQELSEDKLAETLERLQAHSQMWHDGVGKEITVISQDDPETPASHEQNKRQLLISDVLDYMDDLERSLDSDQSNAGKENTYTFPDILDTFRKIASQPKSTQREAIISAVANIDESSVQKLLTDDKQEAIRLSCGPFIASLVNLAANMKLTDPQSLQEADNAITSNTSSAQRAANLDITSARRTERGNERC